MHARIGARDIEVGHRDAVEGHHVFVRVVGRRVSSPEVTPSALGDTTTTALPVVTKKPIRKTGKGNADLGARELAAGKDSGGGAFGQRGTGLVQGRGQHTALGHRGQEAVLLFIGGEVQ